MLSMKARLMRGFMRNRHLLQGRFTRETIDRNTSITALREQTEEMAKKLGGRIEGVSFQSATGAPVHAEWTVPEVCRDDRMVLYFHGGGFVMGSAFSHRGIVSGFAKRLGVKTLTFDYSLAPEHPAPAAAKDGAAMYRYALGLGYKPENIAFAGDSAGGGVALSTLLMLKDEGDPLPAVCAFFSPCTDMTLSGASHKTRLKADPCTPKGANETYLPYYIGAGDPRHPYISPLFGELSGLPPMIIQVGEDETLLDDSVRLAEWAREAGVLARLHVWKGLFHCFPLLAPRFPEATQALDESCGFLRQYI